MPYISLKDKEICAKFGNLKYTFSPDINGVRLLWDVMTATGDFSVMYSSSVDFPEDADLPEDFNLDGMLEEMKNKEIQKAIDEILGKIDRLVEEGNIQELAKCSKRFVLMHFGRDSDETD